MRKRTRGVAAAAGLAALALVAAACGGSSGGTTSSGNSSSGSQTFGLQGLNPAGTPKSGGTLNMLGQGDVDFMDLQRLLLHDRRLWPAALAFGGCTPTRPSRARRPQSSPDLATALPTISNGGKTYTVTIRTGAMWDTSPPRQVTAADALLGLKRSCNPIQPFGGLPDFEALIVGYQQFCDRLRQGLLDLGVGRSRSTSTRHQISGVKASGQTITYNLVHPATYFADMLQLDAFTPAPVESLNYLPGQRRGRPAHHRRWAVQDHELHARPGASPTSATRRGRRAPTRSARRTSTRSRSPRPATSPRSSSSCRPTRPRRAWSSTRSRRSARTPGLYQQMKQGLTHNFNLGSDVLHQPVRRLQHGVAEQRQALKKVAVRQALSYGINRAPLLTDNGGPTQGVALTHVLPRGHQRGAGRADGLQPVSVQPDQGQADAGRAGGKNLTLTLLYRPSSTVGTKMVQTLQSDLSSDRREGQAARGHPRGLLREVPAGAERGQARRVGHGARRVGAGLVRRRRGVVLQPAVLRAGVLPADRQQLRVLQQPDDDCPDRQRRQGARRPARPPPSGPRPTRRS